jgi:phage replication-related protein YjqB (UPF0714/DUF867 family)
MDSYYRSFADLLACEQEGRDYRIHMTARQSPVLIMALHGGGIEPGTSEIAQCVAGEDYSLFVFEGVKDRGNWKLHVESEHYDLSQALRMAQKAERVITIHGCREEDARVMLGGLDAEMRDMLCEQLVAKGFEAAASGRPGLGGTSALNVCNRNRRSAGAQIEVSRGLRRQMFRDLDRSARKEMTATFYNFCEAIRTALGALENTN